MVALSGMKRPLPFESAFALSREEDKVKAIPAWDVESPTSYFSQAARLMKVLGKPRGRGQRTSSSVVAALGSVHKNLHGDLYLKSPSTTHRYTFIHSFILHFYNFKLKV